MTANESLKLNELSINDAKNVLRQCCGAQRWINEMIKAGPFNSKEEAIQKSEKIWKSLNEEDWLDAFLHHPKIGDVSSLNEKYSHSKMLAEKEQSGAENAPSEVLYELAKYNEDYEKKFGFIFIVCATGKSAGEMLTIIKDRINNDPETEIKIAMEEQNKITKLRLEKLI